MARKRITVSFKEKIFKKLEIERKKKKLSAYLNDFFEEHFGLEEKNIQKRNIQMKGGLKNERKQRKRS